MKVQLIIPANTPPTGGNRITAERLQSALLAKGVHAQWSHLEAKVPEADVYHAFNAYNVGMELIRRGVNPEKLVVTWTGTDLWQAWIRDPGPIRRALAPIRAQAVFTDDARELLVRDAPEWASVVQVIPPAVDVDHFGPEGPSHPHSQFSCLVAGGVRAVKRTAWAIDLVEALRRASGTAIELWIAGPVRGQDEWEQVQEKAKTRPWVRMLGEIPIAEMPIWYRSANIVLNCSAVEGVSNALMEAMATAALVVVSNIAGNRYLVQDGKTGLVFDDVEDFVTKLLPIVRGDTYPAIRQAARQWILGRHSLSQEADAYWEIYRQRTACSELLGRCCP